MQQLPDDIARLKDEIGGPFVVEFPGPLPEHAMRLMEVLGVTVRMRRSSSETALPLSMAATYSRDIDAGPAKRINGITCTKCESQDRCRRERYCQRAQQAHRLLQRRAKQQEVEMGSGLDALERMDKGEPQRDRGLEQELITEVGAAPANGASASWSRKPKSKDEIIAEIRRFHAEHGRPPIQQDWRGKRRGDYPGASTVGRLFGSFGEGVRAAGFEPVIDPHANRRRPAAVKPPPVAKPAEPEPVVPEPVQKHSGNLPEIVQNGEPTLAELAARVETLKQQAAAAQREHDQALAALIAKATLSFLNEQEPA